MRHASAGWCWRILSGKRWKRIEGARRIAEWVKNRPGGYPVICLGDFNLRYDVNPPHPHDKVSMRHLEKYMDWVKPDPLRRTEDSHNSVLDFVFVTPDIGGSSAIVKDPRDFKPKGSDHRIVTAELAIPR